MCKGHSAYPSGYNSGPVHVAPFLEHVGVSQAGEIMTEGSETGLVVDAEAPRNSKGFGREGELFLWRSIFPFPRRFLGHRQVPTPVWPSIHPSRTPFSEFTWNFGFSFRLDSALTSSFCVGKKVPCLLPKPLEAHRE